MPDNQGCERVLSVIISFIILFVLIGIPVYGIITILLALNASIQLSSYTVKTTCTILEKHIEVSQSFDPQNPDIYRPRFTFLVKISADKTQRVQGYDVESQMWGLSENDAQVVIDRFRVGQDYPCWYDANNSSRAILTREYDFNPAYLFGALLALEIAVGIVLVRKEIL
jgi:hypothetical protein